MRPAFEPLLWYNLQSGVNETEALVKAGYVFFQGGKNPFEGEAFSRNWEGTWGRISSMWACVVVRQTPIAWPTPRSQTAWKPLTSADLQLFSALVHRKVRREHSRAE